MVRRRFSAPLVAVLAMLLALPATAQVDDDVTGVRLATPYVGVAVEPGETASFDIEVFAPSGELVELTVNAPEGWETKIQGGGFVVQRVLIEEDVDPKLDLEVNVPPDTPEGDYDVSLIARGASDTDRLDLTLTVAQAVGGGVALNAEFPVLRGPADVTFRYDLELENNTTDEIQFGLQAEGPPGWILEARPSGEQRASTVTVAAGESERITVEADPPDITPAGNYPIRVRASGGGQAATTELVVELTGNFDIGLTTVDERLNVDVQAGQPSEMTLVVANDGTAALSDISFSSRPPRGWEVSFAPDSIPTLEPGATAEVTATITPSEEAIAGDYRITLTSSVAEVTDSIELRATVNTSAVWGAVGVGIIVVALAALTLVFRQFGRR